jgi:hypothetical protein
MRAFKKAVIGLVSAAALTVGMAGTASAGSYNGVCESAGGGEACLYYQYDYTGWVYDTLYSKTSYTGTYYGTDLTINDTVGAVWNRDPDNTLKLFTGTNYTGSLKAVGAGAKFNTVNTSFANAFSSHCWTSNAGCP